MSTFTGKTVNEAIQAGLSSLNIEHNDANINIIQTGRKGFLGIGKRDAKVELSKKLVDQSSNNDQSMKDESNDSDNSKPTEDESDYSEKTDESKEINSSKENNSGSSVDQEMESNEDSDSTSPIESKNNVQTETHDKESNTKGSDDQPNAKSLDSKQKKEIAIDKLEEYLSKIVKELGIDVEINSEFKNNKMIRMNFKTEKEGLLIGKHGLTINALQSLAKIYLDRLGFYHLYVELDTADYRKRRMDVLEKLSEKTAREAVATGKPVYLDPMPSFERKKIHRTLESSYHVMTYSAGLEPYRAVVVAPR